MTPIVVALALAAATAAAPVGPVDIWHGARVGMSAGQVIGAFPGAVAVTDGESLSDNAHEQVRLDGVKLPTGDPATARFYFGDNGLSTVVLSVATPENQTAANQKKAAEIATALSKTYGQPGRCGLRTGFLSYQCEWVSPTLAVSIIYMDVAGQAPKLDIMYRVPDTHLNEKF